MNNTSQPNTKGHTLMSPDQTPPLPTDTEREAGGWTIISPPESSVVVRQRPLPEHIQEAISRNLGIGTGAPNG